MTRSLAVALTLVLATGLALQAAEHGLQEGTPDLKSAGSLAFGPDGILFVGDTEQATVFAIDTGDTKESSERAKLDVKGIDKQIAGQLGVTPRDIMINDMAVNPASGNVYLSVSRGRGPEATPLLMKVDGKGKISEVSLKNVPFDKAQIPNAPEPGGEGRSNKRAQVITDLLYVDGRLFIAGLSNEEFASKLRAVEFPFTDAKSGTSVEIYHGAHGAFETHSPVRTFVNYGIDGEQHLLAAYTCTPLVKLPVSKLQPGAKVQGTTIAELGNRNQPLDMIVYSKDGKDYLLIANSARGVMKLTTDEINSIEGITEKIASTAGLKYETLDELKGVTQLDQLDEQHALLLVVNEESGESNLQTIALP